jgi:DNA invertase Pin-like site-specific DNA recombinase
VAFRSLTEASDTSTAGGELSVHIFGVLADFERSLIRERTVAGIAAARERGRPEALSPAKMRLARRCARSLIP